MSTVTSSGLGAAPSNFSQYSMSAASPRAMTLPMISRTGADTSVVSFVRAKILSSSTSPIWKMRIITFSSLFGLGADRVHGALHRGDRFVCKLIARAVGDQPRADGQDLFLRLKAVFPQGHAGLDDVDDDVGQA